MGQAKIKIDIERLLTWAYRDELPKQTVGGLTGWERLTFLGTNVDESSRETSYPVALGPPHPDALIVDHVVRGLEDVMFKWRDLRKRLMGHLAPYAAEDDPACSAMRFSAEALVRHHAIMGSRPIWHLGPVSLLRIQEKNNKPRVQYLDDSGKLVNGLTSGRRYGPMARCPLRLDPAGAEIACARAEYLVWRVGLIEVKQRCESWGLREHQVTGPVAAEEPWRIDTEIRARKSRVLSALQETVNHEQMSRVTALVES